MLRRGMRAVLGGGGVSHPFAPRVGFPPVFPPVCPWGGFPLIFPQALDGDLYERLREHLSVASRTEVETCRATRDWFQSVAEASARVTAAPVLGALGGGGAAQVSPPAPHCSSAAGLPGAGPPPLPAGPPRLLPGPRAALPARRGGGGRWWWGTTLRQGGPHSQPLLSHPVLTQVCLLPPGDDGASLEKEARRWATRVARDHKNKAHGEEVGAVLPHRAPPQCPVPPLPPKSHHPTDLRVPTQVLQWLEARRQQVPEAEAATVERQMEEARENIRKAEVGSPHAWGGLEVSPPGMVTQGGGLQGMQRWGSSATVAPTVGTRGDGACWAVPPTP